MGNEVSVSVPALYEQAVKTGYTEFRSNLRVWVVDEETAKLPEIPEADFNKAVQISSKCAYIISHEYKDNSDPSKCTKPDDYKPFVSVLFDSPELSKLLKDISEACDPATLGDPLESADGLGIEPVETIHTLYLWIGKEASSVLQANALAAALNISRSERKEMKNQVPFSWVVKCDVNVNVNEDEPLPEVTNYFTFADQERERKRREEQRDKTSEIVKLLQENRLARELHMWEGMPYVPRQLDVFKSDLTQEPPIGSEEMVVKRRDELYKLFEIKGNSE